ncbi:hypothetical protein [Alkalithermobacter paradoxus]|uniref:Uncharacterized protein n=1 Tax=Alkalithermobacter paradoxus TaxID=29349 RepID=A0A1V4I6R6_9FIRM|nr:hypothetical protein CLOTH_14020 [[Clostridium] thermoalcaliphilum]
MKINLSRKNKQLLYILLILIGVVLSFNTNNDPTPFVNRIFKPVNFKGGTLYYGGILCIILISVGLSGIQFKKFKSEGAKLIAIILIFQLTIPLNNYSVKFIKSMSTDLNSIYYIRNKSNTLDIQTGQDGEFIRYTLELENCSNIPQQFYLKITIPDYYQYLIVQNELVAKEYDLKTDKVFVLQGKEKKKIEAVFSGDIKSNNTGESGSVVHSTAFVEFSLINDKGEVRFIERH